MSLIPFAHGTCDIHIFIKNTFHIVSTPTSLLLKLEMLIYDSFLFLIERLRISHINNSILSFCVAKNIIEMFFRKPFIFIPRSKLNNWSAQLVEFLFEQQRSCFTYWVWLWFSLIFSCGSFLLVSFFHLDFNKPPMYIIVRGRYTFIDSII